jgi:hypothetical protein
MFVAQIPHNQSDVRRTFPSGAWETESGTVLVNAISNVTEDSRMADESRVADILEVSEPSLTVVSPPDSAVRVRSDSPALSMRFRRSTSYCSDTAWVWQRARFVCAKPE